MLGATLTQLAETYLRRAEVAERAGLHAKAAKLRRYARLVSNRPR